MNKNQRKNNKKQNKNRSEKFSTILRVGNNGNWAPPRLQPTLRYSVFKFMTNAGVNATNVRFVPTYAYDVDPIGATTAMAGFAEYAAMYRFYRVFASSITVNFANKEAFNAVVYIMPSNADLGANFSGAIAGQQLSNTFSKIQLIGPLTGKGTVTLKSHNSTARYGGSWDTGTIDTYVGATSGGAPSNNWYWNVGAVGSSPFTAAGVDIMVAITVELEFFELVNVAN